MRRVRCRALTTSASISTARVIMGRIIHPPPLRQARWRRHAYAENRDKSHRRQEPGSIEEDRDSQATTTRKLFHWRQEPPVPAWEGGIQTLEYDGPPDPPSHSGTPFYECNPPKKPPPLYFRSRRSLRLLARSR